MEDISIHASHAGRDQVINYARQFLGISIHASHAGRDAYGQDIMLPFSAISIHASHAGRDSRQC